MIFLIDNGANLNIPYKAKVNGEYIPVKNNKTISSLLLEDLLSRKDYNYFNELIKRGVKEDIDLDSSVFKKLIHSDWSNLALFNIDPRKSVPKALEILVKGKSLKELSDFVKFTKYVYGFPLEKSYKITSRFERKV